MHSLDALRQQAESVRAVVRLNLAGLTHDDSLIAPAPAGNSANWVLGHLLSVYNDALPLVGQPALMQGEKLAPYARGSRPLSTPNALALEELQALWDKACDGFVAGLGSVSDEGLAAKAPFSPTNNPNETVGSLLTTIAFHQAYHSGQLGLLRRIAGKPGAIA